MANGWPRARARVLVTALACQPVTLGCLLLVRHLGTLSSLPSALVLGPAQVQFGGQCPAGLRPNKQMFGGWP